jgi:SulP family sulfate permease
MSASSLLVAAGARTRLSLLYAAAVMAIVILVFGGVVGYVAMPALSGLLIVIGAGAVKPAQILSVARTGPVALTVMSTTLVLTLLIPLQYAVLVGVGISLVLFVAQQSNRLTIRHIDLQSDGRLREGPPPEVVPPRTVVVLQPYGNIFFATVPMFEEQLPDVTAASVHSVVIIRIRGAEDIGSTLIEVLRRYATSLGAVGSRLMLVTDSPRILRQLRVTGAEAAIGPENIYRGTEWLGETVRRAYREAWEWVDSDGGPPGGGGTKG